MIFMLSNLLGVGLEVFAESHANLQLYTVCLKLILVLPTIFCFSLSDEKLPECTKFPCSSEGYEQINEILSQNVHFTRKLNNMHDVAYLLLLGFETHPK